MQVWLAQVSLLRDALRGRAGRELPALAAEHGFDGVEWLDRLLPSFRREDLARLGDACRQAGLGQGGLSLNLEYMVSPERRALQIRRALNLMGACPELGVGFVRVGLGGGGLNFNGALEWLSVLRPKSSQLATPLGPAGRLFYGLCLSAAQMSGYRGSHGRTPPPKSQAEHQAAREALSPLAEKAESLGLALGVENHWGISGRPDDLLNLVYNINGGEISAFKTGICLDLDNWYEDQDSYAGVAALAPSALHVHYKAYGGQPKQEALKLNYQGKLKLLKDAGYGGAFSLEYEGPEPALSGAVRASDVLRRIWEGLA
ncbi:MAG: sugar phosphate isomerase/epimerase [Desulfarculaceae bacterium]|nr:sugar phosphate isomerase/epimerase [Desulfarculaceae bacterium]